VVSDEDDIWVRRVKLRSKPERVNKKSSKRGPHLMVSEEKMSRGENQSCRERGDITVDGGKRKRAERGAEKKKSDQLQPKMLERKNPIDAWYG